MLNAEIVDKDEEIIKLVDDILEKAVKENASYIHIEPKETYTQVRYRVNGELYIPKGYDKIPKILHSYIIDRVKVLTGTMRRDIDSLPQDGKIRINLKDRGEIDLRVGTIPTIMGESVTLRILQKKTSVLSIEDIFNNDQYLIERFRKNINRKEGTVLFSGMPGAGKTTIAVSTVKEISKNPVKVISIEDPVEIVMDNVNQVQLNRIQHLDYGAALRQALRLDIDVLYISELRDKESAHIALEAGLTGIFVLSSMHTKTSIEAMFRFSQMGIKEYLTTTALKFIMNSKLVKQLCPHCKKETELTKAEIKDMEFNEKEIKTVKFYKGKGCDKCNNSGYNGRIAIIEMLELSSAMKDAFINGADKVEITKIAKKDGVYYTLADDALKKLKGGFIDLKTARMFTL